MHKSKKIMQGETWSEVEEGFDEVYIQEKDKYFQSYYNLPEDNNHSPFNLGIYFSTKDGKLKTSQYVGIMPLLDVERVEKNDNQPYVAIRPGFNGSAIQMLEYVLKSDDFYENYDSIKFKEMQLRELKDEAEKFNQKDSKILFGVIKDIPGIDITPQVNGKQNIETLIQSLTIFEIWHFISKAKIVCQNMLKYQSQKVEEVFVGKIKGKINIQKQIKNNLSKGRIDRNCCIYNKLTIDNTENRILKYALHLCESVLNQMGGIDVITEHLAYCKRALASVKLVKCGLSDFRGIKSNGIYRHYKPALDAAKKVIQRIALSFDGEQNKEKVNLSQKLQPFFIDMNVLFELYCRAVISEAIKETRYRLVAYGKPYTILEKGLNGFINKLIPDIVIQDDEENIVVIDAKYSGMSTNSRERTHQIMAYMLLLDCNCGGFIFPSKQNENRSKFKQALFKSNGKVGVNIGVDISKIGEEVKDIKIWLEELINGELKGGN